MVGNIIDISVKWEFSGVLVTVLDNEMLICLHLTSKSRLGRGSRSNKNIYIVTKQQSKDLLHNSE